MSADGRLPMAVLADGLTDAIGGRRVRTALFTTFNFDPGFFELRVLPLLFDQSFSQVDKVRLLQLEDALRAVDHLAVYYDRGALAQDAEPARLDYRRLDVRRSTGAFHPKLVLLLVDEPPTPDTPADEAAPYQSLVVVAQSANLTRAGWWENVECAHIEEVKDQDLDPSRCPFRRDLLAILRRIERAAEDGADHAALDAIRTFLRTRTSTDRYARASAGGRFHTRMFGGEGGSSLADFLTDLRLDRQEWNLEIISPYFDPGGEGPLDDLMAAVNARETRVHLPRDPDGTALVTEATYRAIAERAHWASLPGETLARGRGAGGEHLAPRRVHAKVYRLWRRDGGDLLVVGSVNLTASAHSHGAAGNLEAAFVVDASDQGWPRRWWLGRLDADPDGFAEESPAEDDGLDVAPVDVTFRFDWAAESLAVRVGASLGDALRIETIAGLELFRLDPPPDTWEPCPEAAAIAVRENLRSSSFLVVRHGQSVWRVLVREENMAHRPSLLADLTAEEILEYWSLLTAEQRAAFLERHASLGLDLEGIPLAETAADGRQTLFDRFAGLYHAFGALRRHVATALVEGRTAEAETLLFGAKYDSLPELLAKSLAAEDADPIMAYVTFLTASQLVATIRAEHPDFYTDCGPRVARLQALLDRLAEVRAGLPLAPGADRDAFLDWYEPMFLKDLTPPLEDAS
ncbi:MAG: phospholipase D family protein [Chromatiales bacterium]|nr:phospholipase D family protein [Chromatiales bacterium]